jgi:hypothetical protein
METLGDTNYIKTTPIFFCKNCDFKCCKTGDYNRHLSTAKHKKNALCDILGNTGDAKNINYICATCSKEYVSRNGLWKHKNSCQNNKSINVVDKDQLILMLIKQNSELIKEQTDIKDIILDQQTKMMEQQTKMMEQQNIVLEIAKNGTHNTNSNNKTFHLQFFLNETCKDAMNIMDFVDSIKLQLSDLENVGKLGYVQGISNIITSNLKALDITQRPIHCPDKKREIIYIKDEDKWEIEDKTKKKIRKVIKRVMTKNQRLIPKFKEAHPDCLKSASKFSDQYNKILVESMGGSGDNDLEKEDKIIRNISKNITIDKEY